MALTLQQLLAAPDLSAVRAKLIGKLQAGGIPTTAWQSGDPERTMMEMDADAIFDLVANLIPLIAAGGYVDYAISDWLTLLAQNRYNLPRLLATYTQGTVRLTNATSSPKTVQADTLTFLFPSGNRYVGPHGGAATIPASGFVDITVQSESVNHSVPTSAADFAPLVNYVDASGLPIVMVTPLTGVTATNAAPPYGPVTQTGTGSGTLTLAGTPTPNVSISIRIDSSGQSGVASWSYSIVGAAYVSAGAVASLTNIGGLGINVTLTNGGGTPSFNAGDVYGFASPGNWITSQGTDQETDASLAGRCKNRWPSLATLAAIPGSPTLGFYDLLARLPIPPATTSPVTQTLIQTDPNINNKVNIYVAGQAGVLPGSYLTALNAQLLKYNMETDFPVAVSPSTVAITLGGATITVRLASLATAQASIQAAIQTYIYSLGINGSLADGKIKHGKIIQIIEDTFGVTDVTDTALTINGVAASLAFPTIAGAVQLPQWSQAVATAFTWLTV